MTYLLMKKKIIRFKNMLKNLGIRKIYTKIVLEFSLCFFCAVFYLKLIISAILKGCSISSPYFWTHQQIE